jgi:hypothetical protein
MRIMWNSLGAASCLAIALTAGHASAALLAYDGFDYAAGDLTGQNGGAGWGGAYTDTGNSTVVDATGLTYGPLATTGGSDRTADGGTATTLNFRTLNQAYGDNETETWISLLGRRNGATVTNLFAGLSFYNSGGTATANGELSVAATTQGSTVPGLPDWRILDLGAGQSTNANVGITPDVVDLLAVRITWGVADAGLVGTGTSAVYLYVNPALGGTPTPTTGRNITMTNFDKIRLAGQNGIDYSFDEIRIGETFADVTPVTVPEPTAFALAGGALAFLGSLRCRRL